MFGGVTGVRALDAVDLQARHHGMTFIAAMQPRNSLASVMPSVFAVPERCSRDGRLCVASVLRGWCEVSGLNSFLSPDRGMDGLCNFLQVPPPWWSIDAVGGSAF